MPISGLPKAAEDAKVFHAGTSLNGEEVLTAGGTDTASIQRDSNGGSIAGGISIPCRYLHQVIEMVNKDDTQATIDLLVACLVGIDKYNWSFK